MIKIIGLLTAKDEEDFIEKMLRHNLQWLDGIVAIDNGSTDKTYEMLKKYCLEVKKDVTPNDEKYFTEKLLIMADKYKADWYVDLDADELFDLNIRGVIEQVSPDINVIGMNRLNILTNNIQYDFQRIYRNENLDTSEILLTNSFKIPILKKNRIICHSGFVIEHYQIRSREQGLRKYQRHLEIDPKNIYQKSGYEHLKEMAMSL